MTLYLVEQAKAQPAAFLTLLGKVLPLQVTGDRDNPAVISRVEYVIVDPKRPDGVDEVMRFGVNARREDEENSPSRHIPVQAARKRVAQRATASNPRR